MDKVTAVPLLPWAQLMRGAEKVGATPRGPVVFECVGVPGTIEHVVSSAPLLSRVVVVGVCMETDSFRPSMAINKEIELRFAFAYDPSEVEHKLDVLRQHCEQVGRDYNSIEKTVMGAMDPGPNGENVDSMLETMRAMHELGVTHFHGTVPDVASIKPLEILAERVIPEAAKF